MLLQGLPLPSPSMVSTCSLPPPQARPSSPPLPPIEEQQHTFEEPEDTVGQARLNSLGTSTAVATPNASAAATASTMSTTAAATIASCSAQMSLQPPLSSPSIVSPPSRTTLWRRRKAESCSDQHTHMKKTRVAQRGYCCKTCGQPSNKGRRFLVGD